MFSPQEREQGFCKSDTQPCCCGQVPGALRSVLGRQARAIRDQQVPSAQLLSPPHRRLVLSGECPGRAQQLPQHRPASPSLPAHHVRCPVPHLPCFLCRRGQGSRWAPSLRWPIPGTSCVPLSKDLAKPDGNSRGTRILLPRARTPRRSQHRVRTLGRTLQRPRDSANHPRAQALSLGLT